MWKSEFMSNKKRVLVLGAGGHAKAVIAALKLCGYEIAGVFDDCEAKWGTKLLGHLIEGPISNAEDVDVNTAIIAVGDNRQRQSIASGMNKRWLTLIHPQAFIDSTASVGVGSFVAAGAVVQPDAVVGDHCIINTSSSVDHDCQIDSFSHVCPGANLSGGVQIREGSMIGTGASIIPGKEVAEWSVVAAGACVTQSLLSNSLVGGVPARSLKKLTASSEATGSKLERVYLSPPHMSGEERSLLLDAFDSNWIAPLGPHVDAFEREFAEKVKVDHAVALSSGTAALHLALRLLDIGAGDRVIVSSLTFAATANAVTYVDAAPVFVDSNFETWNLDPNLLAEELERSAKAGELPKAMIVVDVNGQCADYEPILKLARFYEVPVIEDAAEALGAMYNKQPAGTFGDIACFSFNGNKIITTSGGGMLVTNRKDWADRARYLASQARQPAAHYEHTEVGYNYRMSNLLAAIGRGQLRVLDDRVKARCQNFEFYREHLSNLPGIEFMPEPENFLSTRWLTCLTINPAEFGASREDIRLALEAENIESRPVWKPMHLQPAFANCRAVGGKVSEHLFQAGLCLPSGSNLTEADLMRVVNILRSQVRVVDRIRVATGGKIETT